MGHCEKYAAAKRATKHSDFSPVSTASPFALRVFPETISNMAFRALCNSGRKTQLSDVMARLMSTTGANASKIGFIGLGNMGGHMVSNLMNQVREKS